MKVDTIEEPVFKAGRLLTAQPPEELQAGLIPRIDEGKKLAQVEHVERIVGYLSHRTIGIPLFTEGLLDDQSQLRTAVTHH